ncbi:MAG: peptidylprolyl isomerase [bacterium]|nr:peptidylprolyl isomerase [Candidatus Minthenecus merdequi]
MKKIIILLMLIATVSLSAHDLKKCAVVRIRTNYGTMDVALYNETPLHRDNFLKLVRSGYYRGVQFHRVIKEFMIQAGDPNSKDSSFTGTLGAGDIGYKIPAEILFPTFFHKKGALAAARQGDNVNPERQSSGCQFYITQGRTFNSQELDKMQIRLQNMYNDPKFQYTEEQRLHYQTFGGAPHLDGGYTVFGEVISGFEVIDIIASVEVGSNDRPIKPVIIEDITLVRNFKK